MNRIITISERGSLTLPKDVREKLGIPGAGRVSLECDDSGRVVLRPCGVFPVEMYSDERIAGFQDTEDELEPFMGRIRAGLKKRMAEEKE